MNPSQHSEGTETIDHALAWIERLRDGEPQSEAFFDWLTESPRHVEVFMQAMTLEQRIGSIGAEDWPLSATEDPLAGLTEPVNVIPLKPQPAAATPRARYGWRMAGIAAAVAIAAVAAWTVLGTGNWKDYETTVGEQRAIQLEDGSLVNLNTGSHLRVSMSAHARELKLLEGEALLKVQQDSTRPFRVQTRDTLIQVLGTQFNVRSKESGTTVSVLEGRVRVQAESGTQSVLAPAALSAGEGAKVGRDGQLETFAEINPAHVTAWQQRRLIFDEETLANIVLEFNRYNRRQLRIADDGANERRFSGIFDADDPESLAQLLGREGELRIEREAGDIVIRLR